MNTRITLFFTMAFLLFAASAQARIYIDITSPYLRRIPVAVPYVEARPDSFENRIVGRKLSSILSKDLEFHGFFSVLDPEKYGGSADADLSSFQLDYLIKGRLYRSGDALTSEFRLIDIHTGQMIAGRRYRGMMRDVRQMAHRFCDVVVEAVTGEHGVSLSSIAFLASVKGARDIYISDFDGFNLRRITTDRSIKLSPRFSPDGRYLIYTSYKKGRPQLFLTDLGSGTVKELAGYSGINIAPSWHPDGNSVAVTLSKDGNPDIYVMNLKGDIEKRLTHGPGINVSPTWSPDGENIAFVSDRYGNPQIFVMDVRSRRTRRLTYEGNYNTDPQWSPRGDRIVYAGRSEGRFHIFTIPAEGGEPVQLTYSGNNENPFWSPDGRQIIFSSDRLGKKSIFVMDANGRRQRRLITLRNSGAVFPCWGPNMKK